MKLSTIKIIIIILLLSLIFSLSSNITLFHVIDSSHISLWINWWLIALKLDIIPSEWDYYLACFGGDDINNLIIQYHSSGCTKTYDSSLYINHIYYAKWIALTDALIEKRSKIIIIYIIN